MLDNMEKGHTEIDKYDCECYLQDGKVWRVVWSDGQYVVRGTDGAVRRYTQDDQFIGFCAVNCLENRFE